MSITNVACTVKKKKKKKRLVQSMCASSVTTASVDLLMVRSLQGNLYCAAYMSASK